MATLEQIALTLTPGIGNTSCRRLMEQHTAEEIFGMSRQQLTALFGQHLGIIKAIEEKAAFARAEQEMRFAERNGLRALFFTDGDYPRRLNRTETQDCPALLYVKGEADLNAERTVAVVGTRRATQQGRDTTARLVQQLVPLHTPVVSGLAYGIDTAAHTAALANGLPTVAVLGHGLDRIYPPENRNLARQIVEQGGALLTEYPSGTAMNARYFPARNRIIAALSDAVVVVEASEKGGALITASMAAGYHREVFAVPGRLTDTYSVGTNNLIATSKALLMRSADDIAYQMGWPLTSPANAAANQQSLFAPLSPEEQAVADLLRQHTQMSLDELSAQTRWPLPRMAALLFNMEMQGVVRMLPGQQYRLI